MALLTRTPWAAPALRHLVVPLTAWLAVAACGGAPASGNAHFTTPVARASSATSPTANSATSPTTGSPAASPSTAPSAVTGSYGVLAGPFTGANYSVALVGVDGKVVAGAQASNPVSPTCAGQAAGIAPYPLSTSDTHAYFMDAKGAVKMIGPNDTRVRAVYTLPIGPSTRSVFAVTPDGSKMAVAVIDYQAGGAATRLFIDDLQPGGAKNEIFSESGSYTVWPVGWHAGNLVVARVPTCTAGGGPGCCGPQEYHVVDPANAARRFVVGGSGCLPSGPPSPGGVLCETSAQAVVFTWTSTRARATALAGYSPAQISPDGSQIAFESSTNTVLNPSNVAVRLTACGWIDDTHLLAGGDVQRQPSVADTTTGKVVPAAAQGDCAGRIPGAL